MPFQFKVNSTILPAKYEAVKLIDGAPKNVKDFHDMEDILRYRQVAMQYELLGNARVVSAEYLTPFTVIGNQLTVNTCYYLDGYRIPFDSIGLALNTLVTSNIYDIHGVVKLEIISWSDDPTIAIQDPVTKAYTPTSQRLKMTVTLATTVFSPATNPPDEYQPADGEYPYKLMRATHNGTQWVVTDHPDCNVMYLKYFDAIERLQTSLASVNTNQLYLNGVENTITELQSTNDVTVPSFFVKTGDSDSKRIGFQVQGNEFAALEAVDMGVNSWMPILWMAPSLSGFPKSALMPDGLSFFDNRGNSASLSTNELSMNGGGSKFKIEPSLLSYKQLNEGGFSVEQTAKTITVTAVPVSADLANDFTGSSATGFEKTCNIDVNVTQNPKIATYTFSIDKNSYPPNGEIILNHLGTVVNGNKQEGHLVVCNVSVKDNSGNYNYLHSLYMPTTNDIVPGSDSIAFYNKTFLDSMSDAATIDFKLEYTISTTVTTPVEITIEFLAATSITGNVTYKRYDTPMSVTKTDYLQVGQHILGVDVSGNLKVKKIDTAYTLGQSIDKMANGTTDWFNDSAEGGKMVGANFGIHYIQSAWLDSSEQWDARKNPGVLKKAGVVEAKVYNISTSMIYFDGPSQPYFTQEWDPDGTSLNLYLLFKEAKVTQDTFLGLVRPSTLWNIEEKIIDLAASGATGLTSINSKTESIHVVSTSTVNTGPDKPTITSTVDTSVATHNIAFPYAKNVQPNTGGNYYGGLLSNNDWTALYNAAAAVLPAYCLFVSNQWGDVAGPRVVGDRTFYTSIQAALNAAAPYTKVVVMPGGYIENITLVDNVDILCLDPENTYIKGTISDGGVSVIANVWPSIWSPVSGTDPCAIKFTGTGGTVNFFGRVFLRQLDAITDVNNRVGIFIKNKIVNFHNTVSNSNPASGPLGIIVIANAANTLVSFLKDVDICTTQPDKKSVNGIFINGTGSYNAHVVIKGNVNEIKNYGATLTVPDTYIYASSPIENCYRIISGVPVLYPFLNVVGNATLDILNSQVSAYDIVINGQQPLSETLSVHITNSTLICSATKAGIVAVYMDGSNSNVVTRNSNIICYDGTGVYYNYSLYSLTVDTIFKGHNILTNRLSYINGSTWDAYWWAYNIGTDFLSPGYVKDGIATGLANVTTSWTVPRAGQMTEFTVNRYYVD